MIHHLQKRAPALRHAQHIGHRTDLIRVVAKRLDIKARRADFLCVGLDLLPILRRHMHHLRDHQHLRAAASVQFAHQLFIEDTLMRRVLVDKDQLLLVLQDDVGVKRDAKHVIPRQRGNAFRFGVQQGLLDRLRRFRLPQVCLPRRLRLQFTLPGQLNANRRSRGSRFLLRWHCIRVLRWGWRNRRCTHRAGHCRLAQRHSTEVLRHKR